MTTTTKEHSVNFSGWEVRATLAGMKTVFRRVVKPRPAEVRCALDCAGPVWDKAWVDGSGDTGQYLHVPCLDVAAQRVYCQFGDVGDRLAVKETWCEIGDSYYYRASDEQDYASTLNHVQWSPSTTMPRAACRIKLEITEVRVERLQDISEADAQAEGVEWPAPYSGVGGRTHPTCIDAYRVLWDSINGKKHPWASNPFCWVIQFRRISNAVA